MKKKFFFAAAALVLAVSSCTTVTIPVAVTDQPLGSRKGEVSGTVWLGMFGGNKGRGIDAAAKDGGIKKVTHVDRTKTTGFFGLAKTYTTTVWGE